VASQWVAWENRKEFLLDGREQTRVPVYDYRWVARRAFAPSRAQLSPARHARSADGIFQSADDSRRRLRGHRIRCVFSRG
jgi:hypothetical protein